MQFPLTMDDTEEAREYLRGTLFSDVDFLKNTQADPDEIDKYGPGTKAFWRGVLESAGYISMPGSQGKKYPRIELHGSPVILQRFLDFIQQEVNKRCGFDWDWDDKGQFKWQSQGGFVRMTGQKALEVTLALYLNQSVGKSSCRRAADRIVAWLPKR